MLRRPLSRSRTTSWPATEALPEEGLASVHSMLIVVVLPAPLGPRKPNTSPAATSKSTPRTASTSPNDFARPRTVIAATAGAPSVEVIPANGTDSGMSLLREDPIQGAARLCQQLAGALDLLLIARVDHLYRRDVDLVHE